VKNCGNCRFWGVYEHEVPLWDTVAFEGEGALVYAQFRGCHRILHGNDCSKNGLPLDTIAVVTDGSGYSASFLTKADFSCALHEAKNETPKGAV
jgi:hypothetical protein